MIRSGSLRLARLLPAAGLALLALSGWSLAPGASAQNPPRKVPGGPFVIPNNPLNAIEPGRDIQWTVQVNNNSPSAGVFAFVDGPQGNWLPPGPAGEFECEPGGPGGSQEQRAWQSFLYFPDTDADGVCEPGVTVEDSAGNPIPVTVECDNRTQILQVLDINVPAGDSATITFITRVADGATPSAQICNWGHLYSPAPGPPPIGRTDTFPYTGGFTAGCSCLTVSVPSGFDLKTTKTASISSPSGRLVPGDPDATIQYRITVTNTGDTDIVDGEMLDTVGGPTLAEGRGLEWVRVDDCPAGLTCDINPANTRLLVTGINLPAADPDETRTIVATARVTCAAASDVDDGQVCNQAQFSATGQPGSFPTDDPSEPGLDDPTCVDVVWSNLTTSQKFVDGFVDGNGNSQLDAGERVEFRIRARNAGTLTASGVVVTDDVGATGCLDVATITALDRGVVAGGVITWDVGDLAPLGGSADVRFSAALIGDALCCNQASLQSLERIGCGQDPILTDDDSVSEDPDVVAPDPTCASPGPQPNLVIEKLPSLMTDVDGDGNYDTGDRVQWTITVENQGVGTATNVSLLDILPTCMRSFPGAPNVVITTTDGADGGDPACSVGYAPPANPGRVCVTGLGGANGILPGETVTLTFDASVAGANIAGCCNQAVVTYAERAGEVQSDDPTTPGLVDDRSCLIAPPCEPTGRLHKLAGIVLDADTDGRAEVGESIQYELTFTNVGCGDLTNIRIQDASSPCLTLDAASVAIVPPGAATDNSTPGNLDFTIAGPLAPTESVTIRFTGRSEAEGRCCNQATWTAAEVPAGGLSDDDVSDLTPERTTCSDWLVQDGGGGGGAPDLFIEKVVAETGCQDPGAIVNYTITVRNAGTGTAASFTIEDDIPASGLTNIVPAGSTPPYPGAGIWSWTGGPLASRESAVYKFGAQLPCTMPAVPVTNTATVSFDDGTGATVTRSVSVDATYGLPVLTTSSKRATPNMGPDGVLGPGDTVTYTITVANTGTCDARGVEVTDVFEALWDLGGAGGSIGQGGTIAGDTATWNGGTTPELATLAAGTSFDLTVTVPVDAATTAETRDANTATITAAGHSLATCGLAAPTASAVSAEVCINCAPVGNQQDLMVEPAPGPRALVLSADQLTTSVFEASTPLAGCPTGENDLDVTADVVATNVEATLAAGVPLTAAQVAGDVVYIEVSNRCVVGEGGTERPIIVRKAGANFVVTLVP